MFNSQYYTCEQIDQRLLQGYLDDYNSQNNTNLTKEQFLTLLFNTVGRNSIIDNIVTQIGYYECDTAAGTAAKAITVANYNLFAGGSMKVKFMNKNTANNATLNINSKGDKALYYQGERASSTNSWDEGEVVEIYYDGTSYYANNVKGGSGSGVYDVSKEHPTSGPNSDGKFTLEYILNSSNVNELIPVNKRYPGMSIQFVSIIDNKYIQYRCMAQNFTTDVTKWQGVDDEPTAESDNMVKSGGVLKLSFNNFFLGKGNTYSTTRICGLVLGHTYRLSFKTSDWDKTGISGTGIFLFDVRNYYNEEYERLAGIGVGETVPNYFDITIPSNSDYISVGGRAAENEKVWFNIIDLTVIEDNYIKRRQNFMVGGFTPSPINVDNTNAKFVWEKPVYFRVDGKPYTVEAGELAFSSYTGVFTALALCLICSPSEGTATFEIRANSPYYSNNAMGEYVVAWFYRSGNSWSLGPVVSVYSIIPFTIDGKTDLQKSELQLKKWVNERDTILDFPIGVLVNKKLTASGLSDSDDTYRASQETLFAVPYNGCTIICQFSTKNLVLGIRSGADPYSLGTNKYWLRDGDTYTIPKEHNYYRCSFAIETGFATYVYNEINAQDMMNSIANGIDEVKYVRMDADINVRAIDSDTFVKAVILNLDNNLTGSGMIELPLFAHITDAHGDITRIKNAVDYAEYLNVDALFATGDIIANNINDNFESIANVLAENDDIPTLYCRGNHETYNNSDMNFDVYGKYYSKLADKYSYQITNGKTYYYKDFASKKIRVIAVDPYEDNIITNNTGAYTQAQIDWFIATIKSTPQDYGIVVIMHSPESVPYYTPSIDVISGKDKFFLDGSPLYWSTPKELSLPPLMKIMDTFISRSNLETSFTETTQTGSATINISADFTSGVNSGVEFIAWVCGHEHLDLIGEYKRSSYGLNHRQLVLNVTCATALYGSNSYPYLNNMSDLPRGGIGVVQDAITIYTIDRTNKEVRIARCGSRYTNKLVERDCMVVKYADS